MPLIEITVARDVLTKEEQLQMAESVQKAMIKKFEEMKGRTPSSFVIVREVDKETWLSTRPKA